LGTNNLFTWGFRLLIKIHKKGVNTIINLDTERKLQEMLEYFCKYKCNKQSIEENIIDMVICDIEDVQIDGDVCDICKVRDFIREIRDEL